MDNYHSNTDHHSQRVASPRTARIQNELARVYTEERSAYLARADASQVGSDMDVHMAERMAEHEVRLTAQQPQTSYVREVNFPGIYGTITQIEHVITNNSVPSALAGPDLAPPAYTAPTGGIYFDRMQVGHRPADRGSSGSLPRRVIRHSARMQDLRSQASSSTIVHHRAAYNNVAREAGYDNSSDDGSGASSNHANTRQPIVEVEEEIETQRAPSMVNGHHSIHEDEIASGMVNGHHSIHEDENAPGTPDNHQEPPQYADVGRNGQDQALPPHLDANDPVGAGFLAGMTHLRRVGDLVQTFAAGLGVGADDLQIRQINQEIERGVTTFTPAFNRAAANAALERRAHEMTNDMLNALRVVRNGMERDIMAQRAAVEDGYERQATTMRLVAELMGAAVTSITERREENERLFQDVVAMEENFYG